MLHTDKQVLMTKVHSCFDANASQQVKNKDDYNHLCSSLALTSSEKEFYLISDVMPVHS